MILFDLIRLYTVRNLEQEGLTIQVFHSVDNIGNPFIQFASLFSSATFNKFKEKFTWKKRNYYKSGKP